MQYDAFQLVKVQVELGERIRDERKQSAVSRGKVSQIEPLLKRGQDNFLIKRCNFLVYPKWNATTFLDSGQAHCLAMYLQSGCIANCHKKNRYSAGNGFKEKCQLYGGMHEHQ